MVVLRIFMMVATKIPYVGPFLSHVSRQYYVYRSKISLKKIPGILLDVFIRSTIYKIIRDIFIKSDLYRIIIRFLSKISCAVCFENFRVDNDDNDDFGSQPRVLSCGHSFCTPCCRRIKLSSDNDYSTPKCPVCRSYFLFKGDRLPPLNYSLIELISKTEEYSLTS